MTSAGREVTVLGTDIGGKPFFQPAWTVHISGPEVTLEGLRTTLKVNDTVAVRHAGQKARFRVMWVGATGTPQQGQVGLRSLEPEKDIFGVEALGMPASPAPESLSGHERRRYPRVQCAGRVRFRCEGIITPTDGRLQVLSEGGCYIETLSTAPRFAHLDLTVNAEGLELRAAGVVRDSHAGCGMGIAFREMDPACLNRLQEWIFQHSRQ